MSRSQRKPIRFTLALIACVAAGALVSITHRVGICYAGSFFCWSLTDGMLVLPLRLSFSPNWGPWGFWLQAPWRGAGSFQSQIQTPTLSIPLVFIFWALLAVVARRLVWIVLRLRAELREVLKWVCNLAWIWMAFGLSYLDDEAAVVLSAILVPSVMLVFMDRRVVRRRSADPTPRCKTCGYNLTGNVSGICPECGTLIPKSRHRLAQIG